MPHISQILNELLNNGTPIPQYRPPRWESPIERGLWDALRYIGINADTQVPYGNYRVDMVISSRLNEHQVIIECDGAQYHHELIDRFRDDELLDFVKFPIAHIEGKEIYDSVQKCALWITERWFPEHMNTHGYITTLEEAYKNDEYGVSSHRNASANFCPIGFVRPVTGDGYPSDTDMKFRSFVRYLAGNINDYDFENENLQKEYSDLKAELHDKGIFKFRLSPQELARVYLILRPDLDDAERQMFLDLLDNFLVRLNKINSEINQKV